MGAAAALWAERNRRTRCNRHAYSGAVSKPRLQDQGRIHRQGRAVSAFCPDLVSVKRAPTPRQAPAKDALFDSGVVASVVVEMQHQRGMDRSDQTFPYNAQGAYLRADRRNRRRPNHLAARDAWRTA